MTNNLYYLQPRFDSRKSFYGKAKVEEKVWDSSTDINLYSYNTLVATVTEYKSTINHGETYLLPKVYGTYSMTTLRHIKEFLRQYGFPAKSKKQIEKEYLVPKF